MKLRFNLYLMVAGVLAPVIVFAAVAAFLQIRHERRTMERESMGLVSAAMSAVDAELRGSITSLATLAASRSLESGDLRAFYQEARRVLPTQPGWLNIGLAAATKVQLLDAVRPYGEPAPFAADDYSFAAALRTGKPAIGGVSIGSAVRTPAVRLRHPVVIRGEVRYVISLPLSLTVLNDLLAAQRLPKDWVIALVDRERKFIARIPPLEPGTPISASFREALQRAPEGWFRGRTLEGAEVYTPYVTSGLSGWVLGISIPAATVDEGPQRILILLGTGIALSLAVAALLVWLVARRLARRMAQNP